LLPSAQKQGRLKERINIFIGMTALHVLGNL
jgi:hypothetical protein